jgi:eukaryotic-like serine/threonine-protein kinase
MRSRLSPAEILVSLPAQADVAQQRANFRQAIAALGQQTDLFAVSEFDHVDIGQFVAACRLALQAGFVDDLDWIAPGAATLALYELTTALPTGDERREFGRRVFRRVYGGTALSFTPVAARMAWSSVRQLEAPAMRARVALCLSLPIGSEVNADPMALALVAHRDRFARWVEAPSTGALPARRLAAALLDRASREAVRRAQLGDTHWVDWLTSAEVRPVFERLLLDREPLVWRHAATARGMLAGCSPALREEIDLLLDPSLTPTEWRRAAVSLVACITHDQLNALSQCRTLLHSDLVRAHPSLPLTLFWGLPPVVENDPDAAEELLAELVRYQHAEVGANFAALLDEVQHQDFGAEASKALLDDTNHPSNGAWQHRARVRSAHVHPSGQPTIRGALLRAITAFEQQGALNARACALEAVTVSHQVMAELERMSAGTGPANPAQLQSLLVDLDTNVFHTARLHDLLLLGVKPTTEVPRVPELENLYDRFGNWLLRQEGEGLVGTEAQAQKARQSRLIALLHLVDVHTTGVQDEENGSRVRQRLRTAIRVLLGNLRKLGPSAHRLVCATLARCFDASVREGVADASELLMTSICTLHDANSVRALLEGSTNLDMQTGLSAYAQFLDVLAESQSPEERSPALVDAFLLMSRSLGTHGSHHGETLRQCMFHFGRTIDSVANARALSDLVHVEPGQRALLEELSDYSHAFVQLCDSAVQAVLERSLTKATPVVEHSLHELAQRSCNLGEELNAEQLALGIGAIVNPLPAPVRLVVSALLGKLRELPLTVPSEITYTSPKVRPVALPDWLLPRRTIGAFYVVSSLGAGGVSSVFVAKRIEQKRDQNAELYALKVPQYDPTTARSLSEQEFLEMFRDEAGALLSLPRHRNLARFVNFDMDAKPKPILVMELIAGQSLEKASRSSALSMAFVLNHLDGLLAGLSAMHGAGVAHLDVKPSNVILRDENTPVLVDFGLSGRQLRPGCGTLEYCAPEILGVYPENYTPTAIPADMYAFACTAYELLCSQLLFDGPDEMAIMTQHVGHDGWPPALVKLSQVPGFKDVAVVLAACLRRDPRARPSAAATRSALKAAAEKEHLAKTAWPVRPEYRSNQNKSA